MIRELGDTVGEKVFGTLGRAIGRSQEKRPLPVDLLESDEEYLAIFDAPGVASSEITVTFDEGTILVQVDRFREFREGFEMVFPGRGLSLDGRASLPEEASVDPDGATATLKENGTLHVTVPKVPLERDRDDSTGESNDIEAVDDADAAEQLVESDAEEAGDGHDE